MTVDLALLLKTGARIHDALDLMANDASAGKLRPTMAKISASVASGDSFADALARYPDLFSPMYVALCTRRRDVGDRSDRAGDARRRARSAPKPCAGGCSMRCAIPHSS